MRARALIACGAGALAVATAAQALAATAPRRYALPPGFLRVSDRELRAGTGEHVTFTVKLSRRAVRRGTLTLTLARPWTGRAAVSDLRYTRAPLRGRGSSRRVRVRRSARAVRFTFTRARRGDAGRYTVDDRGLPAGTYRLAYTWRERGRASRRGTATVRVLAGTRPRR